MFNLAEAIAKAIDKIAERQEKQRPIWLYLTQAFEEEQKSKDVIDIKSTEIRRSVFSPEEKRCQYGACKGKEKGMVREYPINRDDVKLVPISPGSIFFKRDRWSGKILTVPANGISLEIFLICDGCIEEMRKQLTPSYLATLPFGDDWKSHISIKTW
ncbi:unnamed protein product [marine sediment metagenome]|uniref:Uncharacterized protein n=1 Tax=marine sediment metagenome TaxID=412755 RepID=X1ETL1_9ZZZZ